MAHVSNNGFTGIGSHAVIVLILCLAVLSGFAFAQADIGPPQVGEGSLVYRSPISGKYETVPLTHTDVQIDVRGLVAAANVTQQYSNASTQPIEAVYIFPLPHDAAVYDMEIRVGNRVIRSVVKERDEAKRVYDAAKSEGKRAALVEEERPNVFTTSVANIMPGDQIEVRLRYVEPLRWEDGRVRLMFPMVVGPRYIPGTKVTGYTGTGWAPNTNAVPDASRITSPVRNPDSRPGHDISVAVDIDPGFEATSVKCISHVVNVNQLGNGHQRVELANSSTLPNKDFVLEIEQAQSVRPQTALFLSPAGDGGTHFMLAAFPPTVLPKERVSLEMLYLIDVSGSMEGTSIQQAREALLQALDRLSPNDRFGIVAFSSGFQEFAAEPLIASAQNLAAARRYVQGLRASGGTEMLPALLHLMHKPETPGNLRNIVLLTDGDLGNEEEIFAALRKELGSARLFTVAIGSAPNHFLATKMAQFGRGSFTHIAEVNEIREQMGRLLDTIENPVLTDVKVSFSGIEAKDLYPERPPDLFLRQPLLIFGRLEKGRKGVLRLNARAGNIPYEAKIEFDAGKASFHPGITTLWARQRVEELMDQWRSADEKGREGIKSGIVSHAIKYGLVTQFTSRVAVEQVVVNPGGTSNTAAVPTELPEGWQMEKVFGAPATGTADDFLEAVGVAMLLVGLATLLLLRKAGA